VINILTLHVISIANAIIDSHLRRRQQERWQHDNGDVDGDDCLSSKSMCDERDA
jgi:hypothetical protein